MQAHCLNYSAHALDDLRAMHSQLQALGVREDAAALARVITLLDLSVKFLLPNCGALLDLSDMQTDQLQLMRLPFPVVAFEFPWEVGSHPVVPVGVRPRVAAPRRIALCWNCSPETEVLPALREVLAQFPDGGVAVLPIFAVRGQRWQAALGATFIPNANQVSRGVHVLAHAERVAHSANVQAGLRHPLGATVQSVPVVLMPKLFDYEIAPAGGDRTVALSQILLNGNEEVEVMLQACTVLNCANVATASVAPSAALNKKRSAAGKQPFYTYKVLELTGESSVRRGTGADGTHASPRTHLRRGHVRHRDGQLIRVKPTVVNAHGVSGVVDKDYSLRQRRRE